MNPELRVAAHSLISPASYILPCSANHPHRSSLRASVMTLSMFLLYHLSLTQPTALSPNITYLRKPSFNLSVRVKFSITALDNMSLSLMELVHRNFTYLFGLLCCQHLSSVLVCEWHRGSNSNCFGSSFYS